MKRQNKKEREEQYNSLVKELEEMKEKRDDFVKHSSCPGGLLHTSLVNVIDRMIACVEKGLIDMKKGSFDLYKFGKETERLQDEMNYYMNFYEKSPWQKAKDKISSLFGS
jgi:hypothetical protein